MNPDYFLLFGLGCFSSFKRQYRGTSTVIIALLIALFFYQMPGQMAFASIIYGFFYGLWPISWIIIGAVFLYKISVKTGQFESYPLKHSIYYRRPTSANVTCWFCIWYFP
ncbi:L-lactate permease [Acinetobacter baumannii]